MEEEPEEKVEEKVIEEKVEEEKVEEKVIEEKVEEEKVEEEKVEEEKVEEISILNSLKENYLSWICIIIAVTILTTDNYVFSINKLSIGFFTFISMFLLSYYAHREAHRTKNLATIIHHYHHEHTDFFSHFSQIILELSYTGFLIPLYYYVGPKLFTWLNPFIIIFLILFYSSVHNINYSYFHVNKVHELHHKYIHVNMGPDICDIIFNTKHSSENNVENTDHYIYNIIGSTIIVLIIQYLWKIELYRPKMLCFLNSFICISFLFLIISSLYLWIKIKKE